jgi:hypothetical protein
MLKGSFCQLLCDTLVIVEHVEIAAASGTSVFDFSTLMLAGAFHASET